MKTKITIFAMCCLTLILKAQDYKKLSFTLKTKILKEKSIYLEPIDNDKVQLNDNFRNSLQANGFKIVTDRKEATYTIKTKYVPRKDTGCGGLIMKQMDGDIIDIKNGAETVANFTFSQGAFEGKCTSDIMSALVKKINEKAN